MTFQVQTVSGKPVTRGGITVTPQSQVIGVRLPFGGFTWNRPVAALVEQDGQVRRVRIIDMTRLLQLGIAGLALIVSAAIRSKSVAGGEKQ